MYAYAIDRAWGTATMHLFQNAETIDRLVAQGELLLKAFHAENKKDPIGRRAEFLRGGLVGWRSTLHTLYYDCAEEIVDRVLTKTGLAFPESEIGSGLAHAF